MSKGDLALRNKAIPFEATTINSVGGILSLQFGSAMLQFNALAFARPYMADLVEARFTLSLTAPPGEGFNLRIAVGEFSTVDYEIETEYTEAFINSSHRRITGRDSAYNVAAGGTLFLDELNLMHDLPKRGDADFDPDGFVVLLVLDSAPSDGDGFTLNTLRCLCSAQMGLL